MAMDFSWTRLPDDLLCRIAMRLECLEDMLAFAGVCTSWRTAYTGIKSIWRPCMPWLILAENNDDNPLCIRTVVDLNNNKRYQMKLPETFGRRCWGCEHGWIFTLGLDMETHLFNPLTKAQLSLPSVLTLPLEEFIVNNDDREPKELIRSSYIQKVHVIAIPQSSELFVMVIYVNSGLAIAKPGDSRWSVLKSRSHLGQRYLQNVLQYVDSIVGICEDGALRFIKDDFFLRLKDNPFVQGCQFLTKRSHFFSDVQLSYIYLIDFFGDIIAVTRHAADFDVQEEDFEPDVTVGYMTWLFEIFIFDFDEREWFRLDDLGDAALFVGNSSAVCIATEGSNCKPNCIYFTDERPFTTNYMGHDTGIYFMKEHRFERVYHGVDILSKFCPPFWLGLSYLSAICVAGKSLL